MIKIKGLKVRSGKPQHLEIDKIYEVEEAAAKDLVKYKKAAYLTKKSK